MRMIKAICARTVGTTFGGITFALAAALVLAAPSAMAQDKPDDDTKKGPAVKVRRGKGGKKTIVIQQAFVIEGRIQKPNAFYVLQRSQINYDWAKLKKDFKPRIIEAVRKAPF
jgi:hypothetical protein